MPGAANLGAPPLSTRILFVPNPKDSWSSRVASTCSVAARHTPATATVASLNACPGLPVALIMESLLSYGGSFVGLLSLSEEARLREEHSAVETIGEIHGVGIDKVQDAVRQRVRADRNPIREVGGRFDH